MESKAFNFEDNEIRKREVSILEQFVSGRVNTKGSLLKLKLILLSYTKINIDLWAHLKTNHYEKNSILSRFFRF